MQDIKDIIEGFLSDSALQPYPIHEYAFVNPIDVPFSAEVRKACERNACGMYGKCWSCPPGAGDWENLRDHFRTYTHAFVYTTKHLLEDSFDVDGMADGNRSHHRVDDALLRLLSNCATHEMAGAEGCHLCENCTYPSAPCRHPSLSRRSMEACGIDVVTLARNINIHYMNGVNTVTYFSILFW